MTHALLACDEDGGGGVGDGRKEGLGMGGVGFGFQTDASSDGRGVLLHFKKENTAFSCRSRSWHFFPR